MTKNRNTPRVVVPCEKCGKKYKVPQGKKFNCKQCEHLIVVPLEDKDAPHATMKEQDGPSDKQTESAADNDRKSEASPEKKETSSDASSGPVAVESEEKESLEKRPANETDPDRRLKPHTIHGHDTKANAGKTNMASQTEQSDSPADDNSSPDIQTNGSRLEKKLEEKEALVKELREQLAALRQRTELLEDELRQYRDKDNQTDEEIETANIRVDPVDKEAEIDSLKKKKDRVFLKALLPDGDKVYLISRTGTRVDTGGWFFGSRMWLVVTEKGVVLAARGRKKYIHRLNFTDISDVVWNGITKRVVINERNAEAPISLKLTNIAAKKIISIVEGANVCGK